MSGGSRYLGSDGRVVGGRPLATWIVARMTHLLRPATLLGGPGADRLLAHGVEAVAGGALHDGEHGGWFSATDDDTEAAYVHAFGVLCEAVTGDGRYLELARRCRGHAEERFADPSTGSRHHELTPDGELATGTWSGQPDAYHLARLLPLDGRPVRRSVTASPR